MKYKYLVLYECDRSETTSGFGAMSLTTEGKIRSLSEKFKKELSVMIEQKRNVAGVKIDSVRPMIRGEE